MALDWSSLIFRDIPLSCALVTLVWFTLKVLKAKLSQKRPMPPGPSPHWFSGNAAVFQSNVEERHLRLLELHKKYGKVVRIQMGRPPLFGREMFSIADPSLCEEVLKSKSYAVSKLSQARFKRVIGANNLVTLEGEQWKKHRRLIMPLFHSGFLSYALEVISKKTQFVIRKWQALPKSSSVETFFVVQSLTLDVISQAAFGYDLKVQENPDNKSVQALTSFLGHFGEVAFLVFPSLWSWIHPFKAFHARQLQSELDNLINQIIQQRRSEGDSDIKRDLLTLLLQAQDPESKYKLTDVEVHDEILTFIFGGFETITSQLCWVLFHLAQNPEIQAVAQEEVDRVLGYSDEVTLEMEKELKYVTNCIKESQRLIPVITGFSRGAVEDTELGGFHVPKGSALFLNAYALQQMEDLWDEPEKFDPTRWEDKMAVHTFSFLPFGGGSRRCAGQPLAVVEMKAVIALILRNFSLKLDESKPVSTKVELAFGPREIYFYCSKRN